MSTTKQDYYFKDWKNREEIAEVMLPLIGLRVVTAMYGFNPIVRMASDPELIGSTMASYEEFAEVTRLVAQGLPVAVDGEHDLDAYPAALDRLRRGAMHGKIVLRH